MRALHSAAGLLLVVGSGLATGGFAARVTAADIALTPPPVGCSPSRPAVAHGGDGKPVAGQLQLVPCATETGFYTGETTLGVTSAGTAWFSGANWEHALARSQDGGAHWTAFTVPGPQANPGCTGANLGQAISCDDTESAKNNTVADAYLWIDPVTSKVFWTKTYAYAVCSSLSMSGDGANWQQVANVGCPGGDYEKIAGGPPPAGGAQPSGYPNVLYLCVNGPAPVFVVGPARLCYKSLDGGATWANSGVPVAPAALAPGCDEFQEPQQVGPDGTLYLALNCANTGVNAAGLVRLALSHDEGGTWNYAVVPAGSVGLASALTASVGMAVDQAGNVYVTWTGADSKPYLAVTRDQGNTWAGPFMVSTQDVTAGSPRGQVVAREPGHVALAYYGYTTDSTRLNGYLTESFDAAAAKPVFYSAVLNDPTQPLYFPVKSGTLPRNDYLGATFGPDGTPWTGMVKLLSDTADSQGFIQSSGFVGRMVPASGIGARPAAPAAVAQGPLPTTGATPPLPYWMALAALAVVIALAITPVGGRLR